MKYIIIDMEWNGAFTPAGYFDEIIEIGAVALNEKLNVTGEFQRFVCPKQTKKLKGKIKELTHITNEDLKGAEGFITVYNKFKEWVGRTEDNCLLSWSNTDVQVLYENLKRYDMLDDIYVIKNYCDAQQLCQQAMDISLNKQVSLSDFANLIEVDIGDVQLHRAINDARLTAKCLAKLFTPELYAQFASRADRVFYERMNFKCYNLQDLSDEQVIISDFMTKCPACDVFMKRMTRFTCKNKKHYAKYRCSICGKTFNVAHTLKMTYDGLEHKKMPNEITASAEQAFPDAQESAPETAGQLPVETAEVTENMTGISSE